MDTIATTPSASLSIGINHRAAAGVRDARAQSLCHEQGIESRKRIGPDERMTAVADIVQAQADGGDEQRRISPQRAALRSGASG